MLHITSYLFILLLISVYVTLFIILFCLSFGAALKSSDDHATFSTVIILTSLFQYYTGTVTLVKWTRTSEYDTIIRKHVEEWRHKQGCLGYVYAVENVEIFTVDAERNYLGNDYVGINRLRWAPVVTWIKIPPMFATIELCISRYLICIPTDANI